MSDENEENPLEVMSSDALSTMIQSEIEAQVSTARKFPRSLTKFIAKATSMATINTDVAESCEYAVPRAGKQITGPSIRLAEIVASSYGNIRAAFRIIANDGKTITAQGVCHDMETNTFFSVEVKRRITDKFGRTYSEDMQITTGNAAGAIAVRNAIFKVVPMALISPIFEAAKKVAKGDEKTLPERRDKALKYFYSLKVTEEQICRTLGIQKVEDIDLEKLSILTGYKTTIQQAATIEEGIDKIFNVPTEDEEITIDMVRDMLDKKREQMKVPDIKAASRIINDNETASFKRIYEQMKAIPEKGSA